MFRQIATPKSRSGSVDGPIDLYWYSYPAEVEPLARQALNGGSGMD